MQYPTACSPQAWSTGAPLLLLRTMLGLEPIGDHLVVDPALPAGIGHLELLDIPGRWGRVDAFGRGRVDVASRRKALTTSRRTPGSDPFTSCPQDSRASPPVRAKGPLPRERSVTKSAHIWNGV